MVSLKASVKPEENSPLFLGLFRFDEVRALKLRQSDALLLYWFFRFALTGKLKHSYSGSLIFFWINYSYAAESLLTSVRSVGASFDRLCGDFTGKIVANYPYPLLKTIIPTAKGKRNYFAFNRQVMRKLVDFEKLSLEDRVMAEKIMSGVKLIELGPEEALPKVSGVDAEALDIVLELLDIKQRGGTALFSNRRPKSGAVTKGLVQAARKVTAIYNGNFSQQYRIGAEFLERNSALIFDETWTAIDSARGRWEAVRLLLLRAVRNYRKWFWDEREPENKSWLTRNISDWLFDGFNSSSLFVACVVSEPYSIRETAADRVFATIPVKIQEIAEKMLYQEGWDSMKFWCKIRDIVEWYYSAKARVNDDVNLGYWLDGGVAEWFSRYVSWAKELNLYLGQIGTGNATWNAWVLRGAKLHSFQADSLKDVKA